MMRLGLGVVEGVGVTNLEQAKVVVDFIGEIERDYVEYVHDDEEGIYLDRTAD